MSEEIKIGNQILTEDDLEIVVQYNGEVFTMQYPTPYEKAAIEAEIVRRLGGFNRTSYPVDHLAMVEATTYVDQLIIHKKSPDWFKSAWTCLDEECVAELFKGYLSFRGKFQIRIRGDGPKRGNKGSKS